MPRKPHYRGAQRSSCWKLVVVCLCRVSYSVTSPALSVFWLSDWLNSSLQQQGKSAQAPELTFREWLQPGAWLTSNSIHHTYRVCDLRRGRSSFTLIHWLKQGEFIIRTECVTYGEVEAVSHRFTGWNREISSYVPSAWPTERLKQFHTDTLVETGRRQLTPTHRFEQTDTQVKIFIKRYQVPWPTERSKQFHTDTPVGTGVVCHG
jgi:hypothetical protein